MAGGPGGGRRLGAGRVRLGAGRVRGCACERCVECIFLRTRMTANFSKVTCPVPSKSTAAYMVSSCSRRELSRKERS